MKRHEKASGITKKDKTYIRVERDGRAEDKARSDIISSVGGKNLGNVTKIDLLLSPFSHPINGSEKWLH